MTTTDPDGGAPSRPASAAGKHSRKHSRAALAVALAYLVLAAWLLPDYGPVWDTVKGELHYGESWCLALEHGETDVLAHDRHVASRPGRSPHPDFAAESIVPFPWYQVWTVGGMLSALSCRVLWDELGLLPALVSHHLVSVLLVAMLVFVLVRVCAARWNLATGVAAASLMVLSPVFFAHACNNVKDVPEAVFYTCTLLAAYRALTTGTRRAWCLTGAWLGIALAQKANALFIPFQLLLFLLWGLLRSLRRRDSGIVWSTPNVLLGALVFLVVHFVASPPLWHDTVARLRVFYEQVAGVGRAPTATISCDGLLQVLWTTPPILLALAVVGLCSPRLAAPERVFVVLGIAVPIGRTMLPGMRNFDGVRHFLEFFPWLALLAGLGMASLLDWGRRLVGPSTPAMHARPLVRAVHAITWTLVLLAPAVQTLATHPNGVCYFNALIGGLRGARAHGLNDAGDYWGNWYWQGLDWLRAQAAPNASVVVPLGSHVVVAAAPIKLRADLRLIDPNVTRHDPPIDTEKPVYVMFYLRAGGWDTPLMQQLLQTSTPVHEISVQGAPILQVFERRAGAEAAATLAALLREPAWVRKRLATWLHQHQQDLPALIDAVERSPHDVDARQALERMLPAEFHALVPELAKELLLMRRAQGR